VYRAVLDTCALVPGRQRDFLLQLATEEAYAPLWGSGILFELDYVLARLDAKRGRDGSEERRRHLFEQMRRAFPGAQINAPKDRAYDYDLDDPDDGHVAHAAILGKADAIVTDDTRAGFKASTALRDAAIDIVYPHEFAANTVAAHPEAAVLALVAMSRRIVAPPRSPREILEELRDRYGMDEVAEILTARLPETE
jgi:predicted nucleic acid-binding protein